MTWRSHILPLYLIPSKAQLTIWVPGSDTTVIEGGDWYSDFIFQRSVGNKDFGVSARKLDAYYGGDGRRDRTRACWRSVQGAYQGCIHGTSVSGLFRRRRGTLLPFQEAESTGSTSIYTILFPPLLAPSQTSLPS